MSNSFMCAQCRNPNIQRLSAIVRAGTRQGTAVGGLINVGAALAGNVLDAINVGGAVQRSSSDLARLLAPPREPLPPLSWGLLKGLFVVLMAPFAIPIALQFETLGAVVVYLLAALVIGALIAYWVTAHRRRVAEYVNDYVLWKRVMEKWGDVFYCGRCHSVTDVTTGLTASAESVDGFIAELAHYGAETPKLMRARGST